ncbi:ABC transporter ATP-binding protein [Helcococcus massiliensis]|uniref:ABC transporter ATP-binding protein n=1 Tax=Helcococcus massiliensis TaxID=2040290 RepID=UPI000CDE81B9|nr:ATP-binding cassette domain-containing protein [Helcococcus massiliensis]
MRLEIKNVNKTFDKTQILHDVTFTVESGRAMGFLGRNGAGKTTTIRSLMDVFKADSGEFLIDGQPLDRNKYKIGYLPEERGMYQKIKLLDQLVYFGELKGMTKDEAKERAMAGLERLELESYANKKMETLSKGNQQKVQILQSVINDPDIIIFDEPFSGLDPVNAQVLKDIIVEYINKDRIVLFSSHQMNLVEEFCDDITFIKKGHILLSDNLNKVKEEMGEGKYLLKTDNEDLESLSGIDGINNVEVFKHQLLIEADKDLATNELLSRIMDKGFVIESFQPYRPSLEKIFIDLDKKEL